MTHRRARRVGAGLPDVADQRHPAAGMAGPAAADEPRRLDAEIVGDDGNFVGAQAPAAVEQIGDGGGRTAERLGKTAAGLALLLQALPNPIDCHGLTILLFRTLCNYEFQKFS